MKRISIVIGIVVGLTAIVANIFQFKRSCEPLPLGECIAQWSEWVKSKQDDMTAQARREERRKATEEAKLKALEAKREADKAEETRILAEEKANAEEQLKQEARKKEAIEKAELAAATEAAARTAKEQADAAAAAARRAREDEIRRQELKRQREEAEEEVQRKADLERRRQEEQERERQQRKAADEAIRPSHRYWISGGSVFEYVQSGPLVTIVFVNPSQAHLTRGITPGSQVFVGTYKGSGNQIVGTTTGYLRPGCTVQIRATLTIQPDLLVEENAEAPGACGFLTIYAGRFVYTPSR